VKERKAAQPCVYKRVGDCNVKADVYLPEGSGPHPVVVWIHGGALIMGWRGDLLSWQRDRYLDAGCAVVAIDYRLAPETKLPGIIDDLQDAFRWVSESGPASFGLDPQRIAAVGHSAGGYLTLMSGVCVSPRPKALVSFYGYGDIIGPWYTQPDPFYRRRPLVGEAEAWFAVGSREISEDAGGDRERFYLYCRQEGLWPLMVGGRNPADDEEFFRRYCPVRNVDGEYPPTLLLHGDQDTDVLHEQSVMMAEALARAGVEHELLTIPEGGHGFDAEGDEPAREAMDHVLAFLRKALA
jgi:acetyl esterase/lipase